MHAGNCESPPFLFLEVGGRIVSSEHSYACVEGEDFQLRNHKSLQKNIGDLSLNLYNKSHKLFTAYFSSIDYFISFVFGLLSFWK